MKKLELIINHGRETFFVEGREVKAQWSNVCKNIMMIYDYIEKKLFVYDVKKNTLKTIERILWVENYEKGIRLIAPKQQIFLSYEGKEIIPFSLGADIIFPEKKAIGLSKMVNGNRVYGVYTYEGKEWISVNKKAVSIYDDHIEVINNIEWENYSLPLE